MLKMIFIGLLCSLVLFSCPTPFGYYPSEEDRVSDTETGESSPPASVAKPYFMVRPLDSDGSYSLLSGTSATYSTAREVLINSETDDVVIYYTTDGSTPSPNSTASVLYTGPISISGDYTTTDLSVLALKSLYYPSMVSSVSITIESVELEQLAVPSFSLAGGNYYSSQTVALSSSPADATIWYEYTSDGSVPPDPVPNESSVYSSPFQIDTVGRTYIIKAMATLDGFTNSDVTQAQYTYVYDCFPFTGNAQNLNSTSSYWSLTNIAFNSDNMIMDGIYAGSGNSGAETVILYTPQLDRTDFSVAFGATTGDVTSPTLLVGGRSWRWLFLSANNAGNLVITIRDSNDDPSSFTSTLSFVAGAYHEYYISVNTASNTMLLTVDNNTETFTLPAGFEFLRPTDLPSGDLGFCFQNYSTGYAWPGAVDWFFVAGEAMPSNSIKALVQAAEGTGDAVE